MRPKKVTRNLTTITTASHNESTASSISVRLTSNSSTVVLHFSRFILFTAHFSLRGLQTADWTTAVAPDPASHSFTD